MTFPPGAITLSVGLFTAVATEVAKKVPAVGDPKNVALVRLAAATFATIGVGVAAAHAGVAITDWSAVVPLVGDALTAYFVAAGVYGHSKPDKPA